MATLPYNRVVDVRLTRNDNFPNRAGFGIPLIISEIPSDVTAGAVDTATRVKTYGTLSEVGEDWGSATGAYLAAQRAFGQNPKPLQVKIAHMVDTAEAAYVADLEIIKEYDDGWYFGIPTATGAWVDDVAKVTALADWFEAQTKQLFVMSYDANTENPTDTTSVSAVLKTLYDRTSVFYHDVTGTCSHVAMAAYCATRNFDDAGSAYTAKFKEFAGIPVVDKGSAAIQAVTGFVPGLGLDATQGHFANTYIDIGGAPFNTEGQTLKGSFIDEIHFQDWVIARTQEEILGVFLNTASVPYTDQGINLLVQAVQNVMLRARTAGLVADYTDENGDIRNYLIQVARVSAIAASQRRQRIAPAIQCTFRYAGAVHWSRVDYTMNF